MRRTFPAVMIVGLGLGAILAVLVTLLGCNGIPGPQPPEKKCPATCPLGTACTDPAQGCQPIPAPGPVCEVGVDQCGCFVLPPETGAWEEAKCGEGQACTAEKKCVAGTPPPASCPACPAGYSCTDPAMGCVKNPTPPPSGGCVLAGEPTEKIAGYSPQYGNRVNLAIVAVHPTCTVGSRCVITERPQEFQAAVAAKLREWGLCAGQHTPTSDEIAVASAADAPWEGNHIYRGRGWDDPTASGTAVWAPGSARPTWKAPTGGVTPPPIEPPPVHGACSSPQPPKVTKWGGPKPHNRTNDTTAQFSNREAARWDGSLVTGFCDQTGWNGTRLYCPARMECKGPEEPGPQNFKCDERGPCEELGVSGVYGGKPLWRSDGTVNLSDNAFQATCSGCTWLEVCAEDGTVCSRCAISPATGLCEVAP